MTDVWVQVKDGQAFTSGVHSYASGMRAKLTRDIAARLVELSIADEIAAPAPDDEPDRSDWVPVIVVTEIHLSDGTYGAGEVLDLDPWSVGYYTNLGAVEVIERL